MRPSNICGSFHCLRCLESDDHRDMSRALVPQFMALLTEADKGMCVPPLDVLITYADDDLVAHFEVKADGRIQDVEGLAHSDERLKARFPVTITVTDSNGKTWETTWTEEGIQ